MFDYSLLHWTAFFSAAVLLNLTPGPDIAFLLGQTARGGARAGVAALFGVWSGALAHVAMAAFGLSAILAASATAFTMVKWAGAAYLMYLGVLALRARGDGSSAADGRGAAPPFWRIYRDGALVAALNPKVAIFFLAFLPQFVAPGAGPVWAQLLLHGLLVVAVAAVIETPLVLAGARIAKGFRTSRRLGLWLERSLGALFIALGLRLAFIDR